MAWEVEYTDEFGDWWNGLTSEEQIELAAKVRLLEQHGPVLPQTSFGCDCHIETRKHERTAVQGRFSASSRRVAGPVCFRSAPQRCITHRRRQDGQTRMV